MEEIEKSSEMGNQYINVKGISWMLPRNNVDGAFKATKDSTLAYFTINK